MGVNPLRLSPSLFTQLIAPYPVAFAIRSVDPFSLITFHTEMKSSFLEFSWICSFCLLPFVSPLAYSHFDAENLLAFANSLFQEGDYPNAIHEYQRYLFLYPKGGKNDLVQFRIAAAYQNTNQLQVAIESYQKLIAIYPMSPLTERARSNVTQCQLLQGKKTTAISSLRQLLSDSPDSKLAPRAQFIIGMIRMENRDWSSAAQEWKQVSIRYAQTPFGSMSDRLSRIVEHGESLPRRSPVTAGLLSTFVPGLGQTYSNRTSDGLRPLLAVATVVGGTIYYVNEERYSVAIPLAAIGFSLHLRNIYSAVQSANTFNRQQESTFLNKLRTQIHESNLFGASD